jgi:hypothetical protein
MRLGLASSLAVLCSGPASSVTQFARTDSGPGVCVRVCVRTHVHAGTRMHVAKPFEFTHASQCTSWGPALFGCMEDTSNSQSVHGMGSRGQKGSIGGSSQG